ncbi:class I tRNA ligase family protein [Micromonospora sp. CB01531]|uniref:class I tRNA ligase family protein n=1 Tax=Micromonospora sp. CB01531 TaxID=1718947 RepID=UPI0013017EE3|nr:class I tRNA ligase family protein [Micromonospora sp. CB01531]
MSKRVLIAIPHPTPNGDLHLGHLGGPFLSADVLRRRLQTAGTHVDFVTGSDDFQSYIDLQAVRDRRSTQSVAAESADKIEETLRLAGMAPDFFLRPSRSLLVQKMMRQALRLLVDRGVIAMTEQELPYCETDERYLYEAFIVGRCPYCGSSAAGNVCEECGRPIDCVLVRHPRCALCGAPATLRTGRRLTLPTSLLGGQLLEYWQDVQMPAHMRALCIRMAAEGLPELPITHPDTAGVSPDIPGWADQRITMGLDCAIYFMVSAAMAQSEKGEHGAPRTLNDLCMRWNSYSEIIACFGFDNSYFLSVVFPAIWLALGLRPPSRLVANEFLRLDGRKFSTTRRHAIWGGEFLGRQDRTAVRAFLAYRRPATERTNFTIGEFERFRDQILGMEWQGWLDHLQLAVTRDCGGVVPPETQATPDHERFAVQVNQIVAYGASGLEAGSFAPELTMRALIELVRLASSFGKSQSYLVDAPGATDTLTTARAYELGALGAFCRLAHAILPDTAEGLAAALGRAGANLAALDDGFQLLEPHVPLKIEQLQAFWRQPRAIAVQSWDNW